MQIQRNDLIGGACAALALGLVAWLSLDSWAITRCEEFLASATIDPTATYTPEEDACIRRYGTRPTGEN
ncbi:MAG: hypothetical protein KDA53_06345 [Hyphomonas sp.]|nr:hypothetical protein [Hyphomonas sp.]